ncbi:hypothetical protein BOTNAR_0698g00040 [Botryotinia narcissicola]|uniref:Uncharacterized protein n=1 Tax=Botryotinia narcissicola TaxID=278944 RepID=A0A4Z1H8E9_9HELO|nr:hypothetical protein BOTNAR_0698g00040 [Botryotinia narcissicola]
MQMLKITAILAFAASFAAAAPSSRLNGVAKRQTTEFGPYPEDDYNTKRQTTEFGPYPEDDYNTKRQTTEFGPYPEDDYNNKN